MGGLGVGVEVVEVGRRDGGEKGGWGSYVRGSRRGLPASRSLLTERDAEAAGTSSIGSRVVRHLFLT